MMEISFEGTRQDKNVLVTYSHIGNLCVLIAHIMEGVQADLKNSYDGKISGDQ